MQTQPWSVIRDPDPVCDENTVGSPSLGFTDDLQQNRACDGSTGNTESVLILVPVLIRIRAFTRPAAPRKT